LSCCLEADFDDIYPALESVARLIDLLVEDIPKGWPDLMVSGDAREDLEKSV
jgi:hypothetical protein